MDEMINLANLIDECGVCFKVGQRVRGMAGHGLSNPTIGIIGEIPAITDDGRAFLISPVVWNIIASSFHMAGVGLDKIFVTTLVKCPQREGLMVSPQQQAHNCFRFIQQEMQSYNPRITCLLGEQVARQILNERVDITEVHGRLYIKDCRQYYPLIHPAHCLISPRNLDEFQKDIRNLANLLKKPSTI